MIINTKYNIGDSVKVKYFGEVVNARIDKIKVTLIKNKLEIFYECYGEYLNDAFVVDKSEKELEEYE